MAGVVTGRKELPRSDIQGRLSGYPASPEFSVKLLYELLCGAPMGGALVNGDVNNEMRRFFPDGITAARVKNIDRAYIHGVIEYKLPGALGRILQDYRNIKVALKHPRIPVNNNGAQQGDPNIMRVLGVDIGRPVKLNKRVMSFLGGETRENPAYTGNKSYNIAYNVQIEAYRADIIRTYNQRHNNGNRMSERELNYRIRLRLARELASHPIVGKIDLFRYMAQSD